MRNVCSSTNTAKQQQKWVFPFLKSSLLLFTSPLLEIQMKLLSQVAWTKCLQLRNSFQSQGHTPKNSHLTDPECVFLLNSEALPTFARMTTGFQENVHFNCWAPGAAAIQGTSQIFHRLQDELDQNTTWTFHGAASRQPDLLIYRAEGQLEVCSKAI